MHEKKRNSDKNREWMKVCAVMLFFLVSGVCYSHGVHNGSLSLGRKTEVLEQQAESRPAEELFGKININTASAQELMELDGIGEKIAARIIAERTENGAFSQIEDIMRVSGIGEKTFQKIKEEITVEE